MSVDNQLATDELMSDCDQDIIAMVTDTGESDEEAGRRRAINQPTTVQRQPALRTARQLKLSIW